MRTMNPRSAIALLFAGSLFESSSAFVGPTHRSSLVESTASTSATRRRQRCATTLRLRLDQCSDIDSTSTSTGIQQQQQEYRRRDFVIRSLGLAVAGMASAPAFAADDEDVIYKRDSPASLTSQLFNEDGSLRDPSTVIAAKDRTVSATFSADSSALSKDGAAPTVYSSSSSGEGSKSFRATYNVPDKWNDGSTSALPLYYDASEGKNGKACNRITVYSVTSGFDSKTLEKASRIGVAKALQMDKLPDSYFDGGVLKADLISGRTVRKPIVVNAATGEMDEQVHYEFDLAFAPKECPSGGAENLGLGFCPYDSIYLISATVWEGVMYVCVTDCDKDGWKIANSDLKRQRSSFIVENANAV